MSAVRAVPCGVGHYLPVRVVENAEFEKTLETSDEWIRSRSGIERRHFAHEGEKTSDLAIAAARAALIDGGFEGSDIDAIILATATPDQTFPSTAVRVQTGHRHARRLRLRHPGGLRRLRLRAGPGRCDDPRRASPAA